MKFTAYLLAVIAVLVGLFVFFKPQGSSAPPMANQQPADPAAALNEPPGPAPKGAPAASQAGAPAASQASAPAASQAAVPAPPSPLKFDFVIRRGRLESGPTVVQVHEGDDVVLRFKADAADEVHLHGYNLHMKLQPGDIVTLQFRATKTGRFGYELHNAKAELGALEVYPR